MQKKKINFNKNEMKPLTFEELDSLMDAKVCCRSKEKIISRVKNLKKKRFWKTFWTQANLKA